MSPLDEMIVQHYFKDLLRESAQERLVAQIMGSRRDQKRTIRTQITQFVSVLHQQLRAQFKFS